MSLTDRETLAALHGMVFGALFLLAFAGGFAGLYSLRPALLTPQGIVERTRRLMLGTWAMAIVDSRWNRPSSMILVRALNADSSFGYSANVTKSYLPIVAHMYSTFPP